MRQGDHSYPIRRRGQQPPPSTPRIYYYRSKLQDNLTSPSPALPSPSPSLPAPAPAPASPSVIAAPYVTQTDFKECAVITKEPVHVSGALLEEKAPEKKHWKFPPWAGALLLILIGIFSLYHQPSSSFGEVDADVEALRQEIQSLKDQFSASLDGKRVSAHIVASLEKMKEEIEHIKKDALKRALQSDVDTHKADTAVGLASVERSLSEFDSKYAALFSAIQNVDDPTFAKRLKGLISKAISTRLQPLATKDEVEAHIRALEEALAGVQKAASTEGLRNDLGRLTLRMAELESKTDARPTGEASPLQSELSAKLDGFLASLSALQGSHKLLDDFSRDSVLTLQKDLKALQRQLQVFIDASNNRPVETAVIDDAGLQELRRQIKELHKRVDLLRDDGTGKIDWAMESAGSKVVVSSSTFETDGFLAQKQTPSQILQADVHVGNCWPMKGSVGAVVIRLGTPIFTESFAIDHPHLVPLEEMRSAPKDFRILGAALKDGHAPTFVELGTYSYDLNGQPTQVFAQQTPRLDVPLDLIRLEVLSNYGEPRYTCVYRVRVHGSPN